MNIRTFNSPLFFIEGGRVQRQSYGYKWLVNSVYLRCKKLYFTSVFKCRTYQTLAKAILLIEQELKTIHDINATSITVPSLFHRFYTDIIHI